MTIRPALCLIVGVAFFNSHPAGAQQVTKQDVPGAINFTRLETTVACGGATKPEAVPEIKKLGFASIINLRQPAEPPISGSSTSRSTASRPIRPSPTSSSTRSRRPATRRRTSIAPPAIAPPRCG